MKFIVTIIISQFSKLQTRDNGILGTAADLMQSYYGNRMDSEEITKRNIQVVL